MKSQTELYMVMFITITMGTGTLLTMEKEGRKPDWQRSFESFFEQLSAGEPFLEEETEVI